AKQYGFLHSETPCFVGRAIAALAAEARVLEKSGGLYSSWGLAREYGFTDLDGSRPDLGRHVDFEEQFQMSSRTRFPSPLAHVPATKRKTGERRSHTALALRRDA